MGIGSNDGYGYIGESRGYVYDSTVLAWVAATGGSGAPGGGSTQVSIKEILTSSGGSVMDSTAVAIKVNVVAGSVAGDTTATVTPAAGSTWRTQPGSTVWASSAGFHFNSSGALVIDQGSTVFAVQLTQYSTTVNISSLAGPVIVRSSAADALGTVYQSTFGDLRATVHNSTIGDLLASVQQNSSLWQVQPGSTAFVKTAGFSVDSSNAQNVKIDGSTRINIGSTAADNAVTTTPASGSTQATRPIQSSQADLRTTVYQSSRSELLNTVYQSSFTEFKGTMEVADSSGVIFGGSTGRPSTGAQGQLVRTILNDLQSTCFSTQGNNSTGQAIVSSVAAQRIKVYGYSITSTVQAVNTLSFASSLANPIWHIQHQSVSSGISGANLAVTPPAWLFATAASEALNFKVTGTTGTYHVSVSYFIEA